MEFKLSDVQFSIQLPSPYSESAKTQIAERIIEVIRTRTDKGLDKNQRAFRYVDKSKFEGNNLTLEGDMLLSLEVVSISSDEIVIGYKDDTPESQRAHGNIFGTYGQPEANPKIAKDFLGISQSELNLILAEFESEQGNEELAELDAAANAVFKRLFG